MVADGMQLADGTLLHTGHVEDGQAHLDEYTYDISELPLKSDLAAKSYEEEMEVFNKFPVYKKVPLPNVCLYTANEPDGTKCMEAS